MANRAILLGMILAVFWGATTVRATGPSRPAGVAGVWAAGPFEVRIALERPADPKLAKDIVGRTIRFEEPGQAPESDRRGALKVAAARLSDDRTNLILTTDPHPRRGTYSLELPGFPAPLRYDLSGVEAAWSEGDQPDGPAAWSGWWPSFDVAAARESSTRVPAIAEGLARLEKPGRLTLTSLLNLPEGTAALHLRSKPEATATLDGVEPEPAEGGGAMFRVEATGVPSILSVTLPTGQPVSLGLSVQVGDDPKETRPMAPDATLLPWVPLAPAETPMTAPVPDLSKGDPAKGAVVFAGTEAKCANCHKVRGQGGVVGPDLSNLVGRDRTQVYRDIAEPSARIHPDYVPYTLALKDGRVLVGTVRAEGADALRVTDTEAKTATVPRAEIEDLRPSATSIMPVGLAGAIGEANLRDLIAFLTTAPKDAAGR